MEQLRQKIMQSINAAGTWAEVTKDAAAATKCRSGSSAFGPTDAAPVTDSGGDTLSAPSANERREAALKEQTWPQ